MNKEVRVGLGNLNRRCRRVGALSEKISFHLKGRSFSLPHKPIISSTSAAKANLQLPVSKGRKSSLASVA